MTRVRFGYKSLLLLFVFSISLFQTGNSIDSDNLILEGFYSFARLVGGSHYGRYYSKISEYLRENVETEDAEDNMEQAVVWLNSLKHGKRSSLFKPLLIEALKQFTELDNIQDKCDGYSHSILKINDLASGGRAHVNKFRFNSQARIDKVVHHFILKHAQFCQHVYPRLMDAKYQLINDETLRSVEIFTNSIINKREINPVEGAIVNFDPATIRDRILLEEPKLARCEACVHAPHGSGDAHVAFEALRYLAKDEPDAKYLNQFGIHGDSEKRKQGANREKLKELFNRYIVAPCEDYADGLGPEVFIPAAYDDFVLDREMFSPSKDFNIGFMRYLVCSSLIEEKNRDRFFNDIMEMIAK